MRIISKCNAVQYSILYNCKENESGYLNVIGEVARVIQTKNTLVTTSSCKSPPRWGTGSPPGAIYPPDLKVATQEPNKYQIQTQSGSKETPTDQAGNGHQIQLNWSTSAFFGGHRIHSGRVCCPWCRQESCQGSCQEYCQGLSLGHHQGCGRESFQGHLQELHHGWLAQCPNSKDSILEAATCTTKVIVKDMAKVRVGGFIWDDILTNNLRHRARLFISKLTPHLQPVFQVWQGLKVWPHLSLTMAPAARLTFTNT